MGISRKSGRLWTLLTLLYVVWAVRGNPKREKRQIGPYWNWLNRNSPNNRWLDQRRLVNNGPTRRGPLINWGTQMLNRRAYVNPLQTGYTNPGRQPFSPSGLNNRGPLLVPRPAYNPGMFNNRGPMLMSGFRPNIPPADPTDAPEMINGVPVTEPPDPTDPPEVPLPAPGSNFYNPWFPYGQQPANSQLEPTEPPDMPDLPEVPPTRAPPPRRAPPPTRASPPTRAPPPIFAPATVAPVQRTTPYIPQAGPNMVTPQAAPPTVNADTVQATPRPISQVGPWASRTADVVTPVMTLPQRVLPQTTASLPVVKTAQTTQPPTLPPISLAIVRTIQTTAPPVARNTAVGTGLYSPWAMGAHSGMPNAQSWPQLFWQRMMFT